MASQYKAAVISSSDHDIKFETQLLPIPELGPSDVLVKLSTTGVCGTDIALAAGKLGPTMPILGHEGVGRVAQLGAAVSSSVVAIGDRVAVSWIRDACGQCEFCIHTHEDGETRCTLQVHSGRKVNGTFAEYTVVPARYVLRIPERFDPLSDEYVTPVLCGGLTAFKALKICGAAPGSWIAVSGAGGGVGGLAIAYAKAMGFRVIAVDMGTAKEQYCLDEGAEHYIDASKYENGDVGQAVKDATGTVGASAVLVSAGASGAYQTSFSMLAPFGTLVCVGIPPPTQLVNFHPLMFIDYGWKVIGSAVGTRNDVLEALEFVLRGVVKPKVILAQLDDLTQVLKEVAVGNAVGKYVIKLDS